MDPRIQAQTGDRERSGRLGNARRRLDALAIWVTEDLGAVPSRLLFWLLRRPGLLLLIAVLTFLPFEMQSDASVRWGAFANLWGVAAAGIVVWWAVEQHSEPLQFQFRIARERKPLLALLPEICELAAMSAAVVLGLPDALQVRVREADSLQEAIRGLERIRTFARNFDLGIHEPLQQPLSPIRERLGELSVLLSRMETLDSDLQNLLGATAPLSQRVADYRRECQQLLDYQSTDVQPIEEQRFRALSVRAGSRRVALTSCDVFGEAARILRELGGLR